jgi:hypothetical protein
MPQTVWHLKNGWKKSDVGTLTPLDCAQRHAAAAYITQG